MTSNVAFYNISWISESPYLCPIKTEEAIQELQAGVKHTIPIISNATEMVNCEVVRATILVEVLYKRP